jgi:hypothetical protein
LVPHLLLVACCALTGSAENPERDSDRDGLSDFLEVHKYGTDPKKADSDGDGTDDGDWLERREYAYTVRALVQVMKPVTLEYLNDDFQDARAVHEGADYVELEVILYPFNTVNGTIEGEDKWQRPGKELKRWLEPGPTSDWTPGMQKDLLAALKGDGIDVDELSDREVVERVSKWLMQHADHHDGFSSFITSFDERGRPYVDDELRDSAENGVAEEGLSLEEQWRREVSARGMFETGVRGSCTSSSIYISGCLRAVGIPTRTVLCIPLVDANDERERDLVETRLAHNSVRRLVTASTNKAIGSWTSHTFNEVWVGGRWRRLNYDTLGQDILDEHYLGLMVHVATFHDWADARMPATVGRRHRTRTQQELFGGANPYSTLSLGDQFGAHCTLENPELEEQRFAVQELLWTDDEELPGDIVSGCRERGRFGLIAVVEDVEEQKDMTRFLASADLRVWLESPGHPRLGIGFEPSCWWFKNHVSYLYVPFGTGDRRDLIEGVDYTASARNEAEGFLWDLELRVRR